LIGSAGYDVITTCSARNFDHVKSLGASAAFDYKDPDCGKKIREHTNDSLTKIFDTISKPDSAKNCTEALSSKGGKISCTLAYPEGLTGDMIFTLGLFGEDFGYGDNILPGNKEDFEFAKVLYDVSEKLLQEGKLKIHPTRLVGTGLESVFQGIDEMRAGKASGVKLVNKL
jgi:NADPH:quinone reductase-like Zn-dependent oxidoreductase